MIADGKMLTGSADDLMPTEDSIRQISSNKTLLAGFDDPEVMRAVNDVAQNPANIHKYKSNKKVMTSKHCRYSDNVVTSPQRHGARYIPGTTNRMNTLDLATCCACLHVCACTKFWPSLPLWVSVGPPGVT